MRDTHPIKARMRRDLQFERRRQLRYFAACQAVILRKLGAVLSQRRPSVLGFYWPLAGEVDVRLLVAQWLQAAPRHCAALPVVQPKQSVLEFHAWTPATLMAPDRFGTQVPREGVRVQPDLLLVPCLGFDRAGYRLGYGGGFYDRSLAADLSTAFTVGLGYASTVLDNLPHERHDIRLRMILTESK